MSIEDLLPAALAAWLSRHGMRPVDARVAAQSNRQPAALPRTVTSGTVTPDVAASLGGLVAVAPGIQAALAAASDFARSRCIELQMAVEQRLIAQADAAEYQGCLHCLILGAIARAGSGVLVTAMRQGDGVEIAVLDDGIAPARGRPDCAAGQSVPFGGSLSASYQPDRGTMILLRLPQAGWLLPRSDADTADGVAAPADTWTPRS